MNAKQKIVHGRGPFNINFGFFVCSFDVCQACNHSLLLTMEEKMRLFFVGSVSAGLWSPVYQRGFLSRTASGNLKWYLLRRLVFTSNGVKIEHQGGKWSQARRNRSLKNQNWTFPFLPIPFTTFMTQWKLDRRRRKLKNQPITRPENKHSNWFVLRFCFRLRQSSFHKLKDSKIVFSGCCVLVL